MMQNPMRPEEALEILQNATANIQGNREYHINLSAALDSCQHWFEVGQNNYNQLIEKDKQVVQLEQEIVS